MVPTLYFPSMVSLKSESVISQPAAEGYCALGDEGFGTSSLMSQCGRSCFYFILISHTYYEILPLKKIKEIYFLKVSLYVKCSKAGA